LEARHFFLELFFGLKNVTKCVLIPAFELGLNALELLLKDVHNVVYIYRGLGPPTLYILHEGWVIYPESFEPERLVLGLDHIGEVQLYWT